MDSARFARIEELFHAALDVPVAERDAFLLVEADPEIRAEVRRLLFRHEGSDTALRAAISEAAITSPAPVATQIGPYHIISELGSGGMGTVLLAERMLGDSRQRVALKLIRGFPTAQARERLARERSLLAGLNHPNIAGLLDAGETDDHVPYLVMEYVEGIALHRYVAEQALDVPARLRLFAQLCRAVQHAHQRLIVHRDIKPGNILVRDDGTAVLLDFGIGKLLDATSREETATRVFTPAYAAPEQVAGRAVTTATDIYGLGCVLFELLSGRSLHEIEMAGRVPHPSTVTGDVTTARALRGELDTLVGKAMHAEPERRYVSAQALADDVENYLSGRPLRAAPDSVAYRARKFVSRHRISVAGVVIICVLAGVFVWRLYAERQRALAAEMRAEHEAQSTRRSRDFLVSLFEQAAPGNTLGHALTARELIDKGQRHLTEELKDEPESAARVAMTIAGVYAALGDPKAAIESGEQALALVGNAPENALLRAEALLTLASEYDDTERMEDARRADEEALVLRQRYAPDSHDLLAETFADLGAGAVRRHDYPLAKDYFAHARAEYEHVTKPDPVEVSGLFRSMAKAEIDEGEIAAGIADAERSLHALDALPAQLPDRIEPLRVLALAQQNNVDPAAATESLQKALEIGHAVLGEDSDKVANVENDLGTTLNDQGKYGEAIAHLEKSIAIVKKIRPDDPAGIVYPLLNLGSLYESRGDYARAEATMREGISLMEKYTPDDPGLENFRGNLARTLMLRGDLVGARTQVERSMTAIMNNGGEQTYPYAFQLFRLARIEVESGNADAAERAAKDAEHIVDPLLPAQHPLRVQLRVMYGRIAKTRGDLTTAQHEFETAESQQQALHSGDPVNLAVIRTYLGAVLIERSDLSGARRALDAAVAPIDAQVLPQGREALDVHGYLAELAKREAAAKH